MKDKNKKDLIRETDGLSESDFDDVDIDDFINRNIRAEMKNGIEGDDAGRIEGDIEEDLQYGNGDKTGISVKEASDKKNRRSDKRNDKKSKGFLNTYAFVMTVAAIVSIVLCVRFYNEKEETVNDSQSDSSAIGAVRAVSGSDNGSNNNESGNTYLNDYSDSELKSLIKDYMENNKGTLEMLREIFPEEVVVFHGNRYVFIPILEDVEKNDIDNEKLTKLDTGEITYEDKNKISHKGIDVSKFQGDIDWKKVSQSGVEYAIVRVGYRGYGTGEMVADENAEKNISGALAEGIKVGAYFFSQAITEEEAVEEAEFAINIINKYHITYPVFFDTEDIVNENDRAGSLSAEERTKVAIAFCERIRKAGYTPAIYANLKWYTMSLDMTQLEDYDKWFAYYDSEIYFPYKISMWQYTESGNVDGISGKVDMNISFKEWDNNQ